MAVFALIFSPTFPKAKFRKMFNQLKEEVTKISKSTPSPYRDDQNTENEATREYINPTMQNFEFEVIHRIKCEEYVYICFRIKILTKISNSFLC
jgi:hypothetical protein